MKERFCLLILFVFVFSVRASSQELNIQIDTLKIYNILNTEEWEGDVQVITLHEEGPYLAMSVSISNNTDSTAILYPSNATYFLSFNFDKKKYKYEMIPMAFMDNQGITLETRESVLFECGATIFLGTPIYSPEKSDYTSELLEVTPTLELVYKQKNMRLSTCRVVNVILNW